MADWQKRAIDPTPPAKSREEVMAAMEQMLAKMSARFPQLLLAPIEPFAIHVRDLDLVFRLHPKNRTVDIREGEARYVMSSQVAWYMFNFDWGGDTTIVSGMYLDREFARKGKSLFFRLQNLLATRVLSFEDLINARRIAQFFWRKRWELLNRFKAAERVHRF